MVSLQEELAYYTWSVHMRKISAKTTERAIGKNFRNLATQIIPCDA